MIKQNVEMAQCWYCHELVELSPRRQQSIKRALIESREPKVFCDNICNTKYKDRANSEGYSINKLKKLAVQFDAETGNYQEINAVDFIEWLTEQEDYKRKVRR